MAKIKKITRSYSQHITVYEGEVDFFGKPHGKGCFICEGMNSSTEGEFVKGQFIRGRVVCPSFKGEICPSDGTAYSLKYDDGSSYVGEIYIQHLGAIGNITAILPQGQGVRTYPDTSTYTGGFSGGEPHGQGTLTYSDSKSWSGEFTNGRAHTGEGVFRGSGSEICGVIVDGYPYFAKGSWLYLDDLFEGEWINGELQGHGKITFENGDVYEGNFEDDRFNGKGVLSYADGDIYEGEFKDGSRHGYGILRRADGDIYEGSFVGGEIEGKGKYTYTDGSVEEGEFKNGELNGRGKYTDLDGYAEEGEFKDGHLIKGKATFPFGILCEGEWKIDGENKGHGKITYPNGDCYEGEWTDRYTMPWGEFEYGYRGVRPNGEGSMRYADGSIYKGEFDAGTPEGKGTYIEASGKYFYESLCWTHGFNALAVTRRSGDGETAGGMVDGKFVLDPKSEKRVTLGKRTVFGKEFNKISSCIVGERDGVHLAYIDLPEDSCYIGTIVYDEIGSCWLFDNGRFECFVDDERLVYEGAFKGGVPCGIGKITCGSTFFGDNEDGWLFRWRGYTYIGEMADGHWRGHGTYTDSQGRTFEGIWTDDGCCGRVTLLGDGSKTLGKMINFEFFSQGERRDIYEGTKNASGAPHGYGKLCYADGSSYEGQFKNGAWFGEGVYTDTNGDSYAGYFIGTQSSENVTKNGTERGKMVDGRFISI